MSKSEKIGSVRVNNRRKQMTVKYASGKEVTLHYGQIGITQNIVEVGVDTETGGRSIMIRYEDGEVDFMPYDQPLAVAKDPEFLLQNDIEVMTARIRHELKTKGISVRYLAGRLGTSDGQMQRLLNPKILNKNLKQLYEIAGLLGLIFELRVKKVA
ncbi:hypothetical protein ACFL6C_09920 [Myxococcota bacterium]